MKTRTIRTGRGMLAALVAVSVTLSGCLAAAAGAGAAGAVYVTERGAESVVSAPVAKTFDAARQAFQDLGITETKTGNEQEGSNEHRSLDGKSGDREVQVDIRSQSNGTKVDVVVKKTAVTWDKDFAKQVLGKIVEQAK